MKKNIVHIHQKFYPYQGGSTQRLLNQLENLDKEKFNIIVISQKMGNEPDYENYHHINIFRYSKFFQIFRILNKIDKEMGVDLLHSHNYRPSFFAVIANIILRKKIIIEMHSIYDVNNWFKKIVSKILLKSANQIIVLSDESRRILNEEYKLKNEIEIIYNGVDIDSFIHSNSSFSNFNKELGQFIQNAKGSKKILIGYIGSLRSFQGIDNVVKIINEAKNDNVNFLVVGGTQEESADLSKKILNKNTCISPFIDKIAVKSVYKNLDILLMPRPYTLATQSAIPLKPIEALASGNLIYSTMVGGMVELNNIIKSDRIKFMSVAEMIHEVNSLTYVEKVELMSDHKGLYIFDEKTQTQKLNDLYVNLTN